MKAIRLEPEKHSPGYRWHIKRTLRYAKHKTFIGIKAIAKNNLIAQIASGILGVYYLILDVWGDKIDFIKSNEDAFKAIFFWSLFPTLILLFARTLIENKEDDFDDDARSILAEFIQTLGLIVDGKTLRFIGKMSLVSSASCSSVFDLITQPKDQLRIIFTHSAEFIRNSFGLKADQINMAVIDWDKSKFEINHQKWQHKNIGEITTEDSAAKHCIETGEYAFFPDKIKAAKEGKYLLRKRDIDRKDGSVFVYPVVIPIAEKHRIFVVSIVTYERKLCEEWDSNSSETVKCFLIEICRRIELELHLSTLKELASSDSSQEAQDA